LSRPRSKPVPAPITSPPRSRFDLWVGVLLFAATFAVYAPVRSFDFVNYDDPVYVRDNPHVRAGLTPGSIGWAFTSGEAANWFPVTRLSHLLDAQLFGMRAGGPHLVNVLLHALAALCLFLFLRRATGVRWPPAVVALLFALHPLHVESVAWVSERKDVLCAFFWFLALWAYVRYAARPTRGRYLAVLLPFCLGLMAKPMIVTLPLVLLLLDFWPLRRWPRFAEKLPFVALSAAAAIATYLVQRESGAVRTLAVFPFGLRFENTLVSYAVYLAKVIWPSRLAVFYPFPPAIPLWQPVVAATILAGISLLVWRARAAYPYLLAGWLWYLVTLAPVIGLVQVGAQARADRYLYVPFVGIAIMLAWGGADWLRRVPRAAAAIAVCAILPCAAVAEAQLQFWKNSESLFEHAIAVTGDNYIAQHNLGAALAEVPGRSSEAMAHYREALRIQPDSAAGHLDLANILANAGRLPEAVSEYQAAERIEPDSATLHTNFGNALAKLPGRLPDAIAEYRAALRDRTGEAAAHNNLGAALAQVPGRLPEAIEEFRAALRSQPDYSEAHANLAQSLMNVPGRLPDAVAEYEAALRTRPDSAELHCDLALALSRMPGKTADAIAHFDQALRLEPDNAQAHDSLGVLLLQVPDRLVEALAHFEAAIRLQPDYAQAHYNLGVALTHIPGRMPMALSEFETALRLRPDPQLRAMVDRLRSGNN
jgi:tetratricopeptide (TPR) repeat protein